MTTTFMTVLRLITVAPGLPVADSWSARGRAASSNLTSRGAGAPGDAVPITVGGTAGGQPRDVHSGRLRAGRDVRETGLAGSAHGRATTRGRPRPDRGSGH